jgi:hypothetical protein
MIRDPCHWYWTHEYWGSSSNPNLHDHLHCPVDIDSTLNETGGDKILQYHTDYNNRPPHSMYFMSTIDSTVGHLHCEFVRPFLQTHRETHRFFGASGVHLAQTNFQFLRVTFFSQLKSEVGNILTKVAALRMNFNIDETPVASRSHSPITHSKLSPINLVSIFRCSSSPHNRVYSKHVDPSLLSFSLSLYRHPHIRIPFSYRFIYCS